MTKGNWTPSMAALMEEPGEILPLLTQAYNDYADAIFRHCYFRVHDRERAKELVQETYLKTWQYLQEGKSIEYVKAFLYRTANNLIIDEARKNKKRRVESLEALQETGFDVGDEEQTERWKQKIDAQKVLDVLDGIDQPYRDVLIMRYIDELSPAEIAEATRESANTISVRIHRAEKMLRTQVSIRSSL